MSELDNNILGWKAEYSHVISQEQSEYSLKFYDAQVSLARKIHKWALAHAWIFRAKLTSAS